MVIMVRKFLELKAPYPLWPSHGSCWGTLVHSFYWLLARSTPCVRPPRLSPSLPPNLSPHLSTGSDTGHFAALEKGL
jgi:hypothetical protein